jgi:hypothetical protein
MLHQLRDAVETWDLDPRGVSLRELDKVNDVRTRLQLEAALPPTERWASLALELDPRLLHQNDWPATAATLQLAHEQGHDVRATAVGLAREHGLGDRPARDLRYLIASRTGLGASTKDDLPTPIIPVRADPPRPDENRLPRQAHQESPLP